MKRMKFLIGMLGISLAFVMAGCDTGTSNGGKGKPAGTDTETTKTPESRTFTSEDGSGTSLVLTEILTASVSALPSEGGAAYSVSDPQAGEVFNYELYNNYALISSGKVTISIAAIWTFTSSTGLFTFTASYSDGTLAFSGKINDAVSGSDIKPVVIVPEQTPSDSGDESGGSDKVTYTFAETMWGEWLRMDAEEIWYISGASIKINGNASTKSVSLSKQSDRVIEVTEGGGKYYLYASRIADASFTGRVAGIGQAISSMLMSVTGSDGRTVAVENLANGSKKSVQTDGDGIFTVDGIIPGDKYEITPEGGTPVTVTPVADGDDVGTITVTQGVNFKSSINAKDSSVDMNELYAQKTYTFNLVIENTGDADCTAATYWLRLDDDLIVETLPPSLLGTIEPGKNKTLEIRLSCKPIQNEYEFKKIGITITDPINNKTWEDSVSLKFHKEEVSLYIRSNKPVYGIVITPNGKTSSILNATWETFTFPWSEKDHLVVFSGATADTETKYSFGLNVMPDTNWDGFNDAKKYEPNDTEADAQPIGRVPGKIMAYLHKDDIDYYRVNFNVNAPGTPAYGITLDVSGDYTFPEAAIGYGAQDALEVTITNTGNQPTGNLTITQYNSTTFTLNKTKIDSITANENSTFTITPKAGRGIGTGMDTVTVIGGNGISASFKVSFTVSYGITLSESGTCTFPSATIGYKAQDARIVTVTNTGYMPTENLTITITMGANSAFALSTTTISSIAVGDTATFTVAPQTGLAVGIYTATVMVRPGSVGAKGFDVSFSVFMVDAPAGTPTYSITLSESESETYTFPDAIEGYEAQEAKSVTVTNIGYMPTGEIAITFSTYYSYDSTSAFILSTTTMSSLAWGETATFTIAPQIGLIAGSYTAMITVKGITARSFRVSFTVGFPPLPPAPEGSLTSLIDALAYLDSHTGGKSVGNPITVKMHVNLSHPDNSALVSTLTSMQKYIALDLSSCLMRGTSTGGSVYGQYIVSLVLPDVATAIWDASESNRANYLNTNLKTVSGANITTIGDYAFYKHTSLTTVSFPKVTTIGSGAFGDCTSLTSVSFPNATTIGTFESSSNTDGAFYHCTSLTSVYFPEVTTIRSAAFRGCSALTTVSFPKTTNIGNSAYNWGGRAFSDCTSLTSVSFPAAPNIGKLAFSGCSALTSASFPNAGYIGDYAFQSCTSLTTVFIPKVTSIGTQAFASIGTRSLTITMGATVPTVGANIFNGVTATKNVMVRVPSGAEGYTSAWGTTFKGYGSGTTHGTVNSNINLVFEYY
jgi:uncharacterized membrane protein